MDRVLVVHGGGPTAVLNSSLLGVIRQAEKYKDCRVYGALGGTSGILEERFIDLSAIPEKTKELFLQTPASVIGSSRTPLEAEDYERMRSILKKCGFSVILFNGGNGTMDACGKLYKLCESDGIRVLGIPKTMDNDLAVTDHSPGYGSAARYMAGSISEVIADLRSLPIHIVVVEAFGRNAGWITAASCLSRLGGLGAPDLIYLPERVFSEEQFLSDCQKLIDKKGCGIVVASEGLHYEDGTPIVKPVFQNGRSVYFGDVSAHLAQLITQKLGYKSRSEKPGILGRASIAWQSSVDRREAYQVGTQALSYAMEGLSGKMVALRRVSGSAGAYACEFFPADIEQVMLAERKMPEAFINEEGNHVTEAFYNWARPLIGEGLPQMADLSSYLG